MCVAGHSTERPPTWDTCYIGCCCVEAVWVGQGADGSGTAVLPAYSGSLRSTTQPNKVSNVASPLSDATHPTYCSAQPPKRAPITPHLDGGSHGGSWCCFRCNLAQCGSSQSDQVANNSRQGWCGVQATHGSLQRELLQLHMIGTKAEDGARLRQSSPPVGCPNTLPSMLRGMIRGHSWSVFYAGV